VVGVAPDLQYEEFGEETESSRLQIHLPYGIRPWRTMALLVRSEGPAEGAAPAVRAALREVDPTLPLFETMTMDRRLRATRWGQRLFGLLFGVYGAAALVLAFAGIYGVMAYSVARRRGEIGLRMALGASAATVLREVTLRGLRITLAGAAAGLLAALVATRALRGLLYGVGETDPATFLGVTGLMAAVAIVAAVIPARTATRLQPSDALRLE
jgi:ABC-type antimicrobial peptide transport system permease subunit